ncbi:hypothetical protein EXE59_16600 [Nocardioides eburneiflavus]|uniref:Uncharacterized protein n=1 Tax=Nocardioides eburneiflavus TaxID=2518372 RepID=A0A4Z1CKK6_9ACTN|nr:hypothetical protein [Nocardioides eburneiflavus]TGN65393.1 hypothetical protein EXE59_16600 [Nocardioides eburneiflavus]
MEFSSDSNEDGWTYADMMLKSAARRAGVDLGYSADELDIEFSQDGWTRTTLPEGHVLVCCTEQVSASPWHRVLRKPTEDELSKWAGAADAVSSDEGEVIDGTDISESYDPFALVTEDGQERTVLTRAHIEKRRRAMAADALFMSGTSAIVSNLLHDLEVPGEEPVVSHDHRYLQLSEMQARALVKVAWRSLPKCLAVEGHESRDDNEDEYCSMPGAVCDVCRSEARSLPEWHPTAGGTGFW